ncbi:hypothetical protein SAMN06265338_101171 [Rhodoblastus acidophilus]|uniref:Uncharacterized protein n=1 Tax=Rhodoblastus acidophilus TaxID=1074 RepID=A0A212PYA0_RHOAC|nr:hypothetical protein [Rhodoblastus acidophilus]SNB52036.1 hypothetical protein SAMN06265338_101171 [Rhodoblastus acidophilus]
MRRSVTVGRRRAAVFRYFAGKFMEHGALITISVLAAAGLAAIFVTFQQWRG